MFSERATTISPSITLAISAKAKAMKKQGIDVVGFGAGEPDFDTPVHIKERAKKAIDQGYTRYTPASGMPELKQAVVKKFREDNGLEYTQDEVLIGSGAKYVIFEIIFSLVGDGDEVIIPSPYWLSYPEMVKLAGGRPVYVDTKGSDFKLTPKQLLNSITDKTKLVIINSPANPTGVVYSQKELKELADIIVAHDIFCISDEIYEKLIYDGLAHVSVASFSQKIKEKTIVVNGVSKAYAMTGWRIGYAGGPKEVIQKAGSIQSHTTSNPASISQWASVEALEGPQESTVVMSEEFAKRRDYLVQRIKAITSLKYVRPQGAFYCFVDISKLLGSKINDSLIEGSVAFAELLLSDQYVAVVPGKAFGDDNFIRLSYAVSMEQLEKGMDRIEKFINKLE